MRAALVLPLVLCACTNVSNPIAFVAACPIGDKACQRNKNAETLHYIGQTHAAWGLMCSDPEIKSAIDEFGQPCGVY